MKLRIANAVLLTVCVFFLAVYTGTVPLTIRSGLSAGRAYAVPAAAVPSALPAADETALSPTPEGSPVPSLPPEDAETPLPSPRLVATTITGESPLVNDTAYELDPEALLAEGLTLTLPAEGYQVLILHTHATEAYTPDGDDLYEPCGDFRTEDPAYSVIRVGDELADVLTGCGLRVLHDTTLHDFPGYSGSYSRSAETAAAYLEAYPEIRVIIDLHRDALGDDEITYKPVADIDGAAAAQLMFVMGSDSNLEHPLWRENLKLALTLQRLVEERYPTLMRPTVLCDYRYNQHLTPGCLLLEVGAAGNTLQEALTAVRLFGEVAGPALAALIGD